MTEIKSCPFCGVTMETIFLIKRGYVHHPSNGYYTGSKYNRVCILDGYNWNLKMLDLWNRRAKE